MNCELLTKIQMFSLIRIAQPIYLCIKYWKQNYNICYTFWAMIIWVTSGQTFFFFVFVFCVSNSAANVEIELQSLIANKTGKFLVIIIKITFCR